MGDYFYFFLLVLLILAVFLRDDFILTMIYLLVGAFIFGRWWGRKGLEALKATRVYMPRIFYGEKITVRLEIENSSWLPVVWLQLRENLPHELAYPSVFQRVVTVPPKGRLQFEYSLEGRRRGYYPVGPLNLYSSDILGAVGNMTRVQNAAFLTVYPKIVTLARVNLPSKSPLGTLRYTQPIFEDPTRVRGKRDYIAGDSLRRVDWKTTASAGRLQVKQFEPSIALETAIFLNLTTADYDLRTRYDTIELGVVVAASLANWISRKHQSIGLLTNGIDPLLGKSSPQPIAPRKGHAHLMRILDILARVESGETFPFAQLIRQESLNLSWGTTIIVITTQVGDELFDTLFQARRAGLQPVLILIGLAPDYLEIRRRSDYFGFPLFHISRERDLDIWRC